MLGEGGKEEEKGRTDHSAGRTDAGERVASWPRRPPFGAARALRQAVRRRDSAWASFDSPVAPKLTPSQKYNRRVWQRQATRRR